VTGDIETVPFTLTILATSIVGDPVVKVLNSAS
jgi:hypothetical protein